MNSRSTHGGAKQRADAASSLVQDFGTKKGRLGKQQLEMMRQTESLLAAQASIGGGVGGKWQQLLEVSALSPDNSSCFDCGALLDARANSAAVWVSVT
eukprot:SAG31_NODE_14869_length_783_cov_0.777778_1_plen_97_part_10